MTPRGRKQVAGLAISLAVALVTAASAQTAALGEKDVTAELLSELLTEWNVPGGVFAVLDADGAVRIHAIGNRSMSTPAPVSPDDCFYIGSLTKTYVATIALQLVDEGHLALDGTLADYLPQVPRSERITIRQLLNHTSGLEDAYTELYYRPLEEMLDAFSRPWTKEELLALGLELPPRFEPGTDYYYSGTNYDVLATVIERITGNTLAEELSLRLFEPLGLDNTWMALGRQPPTCLVTGHLAPTEFWEHSEILYPELAPATNIDEPMKAWAAGGLGSTATEMLRFAEALFGGELLSEQSFAEMSTFLSPRDVTQVSRNPDGFGYGLGLIHFPREGYRRIGHGGMYSGYTVGLWQIPEADIVVALLLNRGLLFDERRILDRMVESLMSAEPSTSSEP